MTPAVLGAAALVGILTGVVSGPRLGSLSAAVTVVLGAAVAVVVRVRGARSGRSADAGQDELPVEVTLAPPLLRLVPRDAMEPHEDR